MTVFTRFALHDMVFSVLWALASTLLIGWAEADAAQHARLARVLEGVFVLITLALRWALLRREAVREARR